MVNKENKEAVLHLLFKNNIMRNEKIWNIISEITWDTIDDLSYRVEMGYIPMEDLNPKDRKLVKKYINSETLDY